MRASFAQARPHASSRRNIRAESAAPHPLRFAPLPRVLHHAENLSRVRRTSSAAPRPPPPRAPSRREFEPRPPHFIRRASFRFRFPQSSPRALDHKTTDALRHLGKNASPQSDRMRLRDNPRRQTNPAAEGALSGEKPGVSARLPRALAPASPRGCRFVRKRRGEASRACGAQLPRSSWGCGGRADRACPACCAGCRLRSG